MHLVEMSSWRAAVLCGRGRAGARPSMLVFAVALTCASAQAQGLKYLYTQPDPSSSGGIKGKIVSPAKPIKYVFALPPNQPKFIYIGTVTGTDSREFVFEHLPPEKYDLIVMFEDCFYEGLVLSRAPNTLTKKDMTMIDDILSKSEPFFNIKNIHRIEGTTGKGTGSCRGIASFLRKGETGDFTGALYDGVRFSLKLVLLEDVGPAWQVKKTREITVFFLDDLDKVLKHHYSEKLLQIRVTDSIKDVGEINLTKKD